MLPLKGGNRTSIVWSEEAAEAARVLALDDVGFLAELDRRFAGRLGALRLDGPRGSWPLEMHLARRFVAPRLALVGDTARGVHPIAGQGLNIGFRDVAALAEAIADARRLGLDIGEDGVLERYQRWRRFDSVASASAMDAINRLFSNDVPLVRSLRDFGLRMVDRAPRLKGMIVREAGGLTGELPRLMKGEAL
jgi:2-octaprenyl-6-methoxyphenol hydroxylase